jgi:hypothetical protein
LVRDPLSDDPFSSMNRFALICDDPKSDNTLV